MSIFDIISKKIQDTIPDFYQPGSQAEIGIKSIPIAGKQPSKLGTQILESSKAVPGVVSSVFENISRIAGGLSQRYGILAEPEAVKPITPKETISATLENQPMFGEVVKKKLESTPLGRITGLPAVGGFVSELLLPPYGPKGLNIAEDLAKTVIKSDAEKILLKGIRGITKEEATILAEKFVPINDAKKIETELENFLKTKTTTLTPKPSVEQKPVERGFVSSAKEVLPEAEKIAGQYIPRSTDELAIKARNLIADNINEAEKLALTGTDDKAVATASELLKHYAQKAMITEDLATKNAIFDQAAEIANVVARKLTEQGRSVQAASILGRLTPEGQVRFAAKEIQRFNRQNPLAKIPELTGEQTQKITGEMNRIQAMKEGEEKAMAFQNLQKYVQSLIPSPNLSKWITIWKAGLLTGIKTSGLNIFSNISHMGAEIGKDIVATGIDKLLSLITGKRTKAFTVRGLQSGLKEGAEKGFKYLKTGYDERNLSQKLDFKQVNFKNKYLQTYVDTVFRVLGTEDQPFYYGALRRSLNDQALAQGINKGLKGSELEQFAKKLASNPDDQMSLFAVADAETAVFQNRTRLGEAARKIQEIPGGEFVLPFGRTPSAVAMQIINYSPVGPVKEILQQIIDKKFNQRRFSEAMGRGVVGTGAMWLGGELFKKGLMTLDNPKSERENELWKAEGRKANSIKIGNSWRTSQTLGPVGNVLLLGGHFKKAFTDSGSPTGAITQAVFGTLKSFTEQTFLRGVNDVLSAVMDPQRSAERVATNFISSFIPTLINDVARSTDPKERRVESIVQGLQSRLPILRQGLEPQINILGQQRESVGNALEILIDPTRPSPDISTPVTQELRRLMDAGFNVSPTLLGDKAGYEGLTPEQNTKLWELSGQITNKKLESLFKLRAYEALPDDKKGKKIEEIINQAKINARTASVLELTQDLQGKDLIKKLSELKAGGILTREVLKKYQELR